MSSSKDFKAEAIEIFDQQAMAELAIILRTKDSNAIAGLQRDLQAACAHFRAIVSTLPCDLPDAPFNLSLTKRADWLEANVINSAQRLLEALAEDKRPMFSTWPYPLSIPVFPDRSPLRNQLESLLAEAVDLRDALRGQQADDAGHSQEFRMEFFMEVARILRRHCPETKPNRGVYDPEAGRRRGVYVDAMRFIHKRILGIEENLDRLIRGEIGMPS